jgi:hypothetical protein
VSEIYHERRQPLIGPRTPVERVVTATRLLYVPVESELQACQPIRRETMRVTRRHLRTADGREGLEVTEEHDVVYGPPRSNVRRDPDAVRIGLAGIVAFLIICIAFTMFGGGEQSMALIPVYWTAFGTLWWSLS